MLYRPNTFWTWAFFLSTLVEAIAGIVMQGLINRILLVPLGFNLTALFDFFIFGYVYQLLLVYDTLAKRNIIQVLGLCVYAASMSIYGGIQVQFILGDVATDEATAADFGIDSRMWQQGRALTIALPCVMGVFTIMICTIGWRLYDEFSWALFKFIDADLVLRRRFLIFQIYISLLKFDLFFFLGFLVQIISYVEVILVTDVEVIVPLAVLSLFLASYVVRREHKVGAVFLTILHVALLGFLLFKIISWNDAFNSLQDFPGLQRVQTYFTTMAVLLNITTILVGIVCIRNFGKGLKPYVASNWRIQELQNAYRHPSGQHETRESSTIQQREPESIEMV